MFGQRYRIEHDPAHVAEHGTRSRIEDPALLIIPCRFGHFFPWGGECLAFSSNGRGATANKVAALPFVEVWLDCDDGAILLFHVRHFAEVAAIVRPKRRRRLSSSHREALAKGGTRTRFGRNDGTNRSNSGRERVQVGKDDPRIDPADSRGCEGERIAA